MNFSFDSIKHKSKTQNEDFYFELETPRGQFFAVLDFAPHDYANLNATLKGKLETIVGSFVSLSKFSADLFLGFLAKEINNFLYNLREQAGGPELVCSAGLCLLHGNRLSYFLCGDVGISIHNDGRVLPLQGAEADTPEKQLDRLGRQNQEAPLSERVQAFTLQERDIVLIMTQGLEGVLEIQELSSQIAALNSSDPALISSALMKASAASTEDRTLVVISGPYETSVEPDLADLIKSVASLETRLNALADRDRSQTPGIASSILEPVNPIELLSKQIEALREEVREKVERIDILELDEKLKNFGVVLSGKADTAEVLSLQSEVLKLGLLADAGDSTPAKSENLAALTSSQDEENSSPGAEREEHRADWQRSLLLKVAGLVFLLGFAGAFAGAWIQSRVMRQPSASIPAAPTPQASPIIAIQPTPLATENPTPGTMEITTKPGDSLRKLAQQHNVPEGTLRELNPGIKRWNLIQPGQKLNVPASATASPAASPQPTSPGPSTSPNGTMEVTVVPGDSINRFALRFKTTPERIKELNPGVTNWGAIQAGQKILVPISPSG